MFVVALVLAIIAPIFASLVQLAVSRQREYLADASSVELTRNPYGLERALAKIAADPEPLEEANRATQHLYIVNPDQEAQRPRLGALLDPPADPRSHQPPAAADRRAAARPAERRRRWQGSSSGRRAGGGSREPLPLPLWFNTSRANAPR